MPKGLNTEPMERFLNYFDIKENGCWHWNKPLDAKGYGNFWIGRNSIFAHRFSYTIFKSDIPTGLTIDHLCKNTACVNPDHLEAVSQKENVHRSNNPAALNLKKTTCPRGHLYDLIDKRGYRHCTKCDKELSKIRSKRRHRSGATVREIN